MDRALAEGHKFAHQAEVPDGRTGIMKLTTLTVDRAANQNVKDFLMAIATQAETLQLEPLEGEELRWIARKAMGGEKTKTRIAT